MKKREIRELKNKNTGQIRKTISDLEKEIVEVKFELKQSKAKNLHAFSEKKKDIARVKTILAQKLFEEREATQNAK